MKQIFLLLITFFGVTAIANGQAQIATLSHEGNITTFYGGDSFKEAYGKAENGDVITLSSGSFNAVDIKKLITIRGAGMGVKVDESSMYTEPTIIVGKFDVIADADDTHHLTMEGISNGSTMTLWGTNGTQFIKCKFYDVRFEANKGSLQNGTFIHCYVSNSFVRLYNTTFTGISSYFKGARFDGASCLFNLNNCVIEVTSQSNLRCTALKNCIIVYNGGENNPHCPVYSVYNTLWYGKTDEEYPFGTTAVEQSNYVMSPDEKLFEDNTFGKLTTEGKKFLGADGKEIGIYGGDLPFDPTPSCPQIAKFNVASKTTADGKLSIDIEVKQP